MRKYITVISLIFFSIGFVSFVFSQVPKETPTPVETPIVEQKPTGKTYNVEIPALSPGDTLVVSFGVTSEKSPDIPILSFTMPSTNTLISLYQEEYKKASEGLDQVIKALDSEPTRIVNTAIYQQNIVGEQATLKKIAELIQPIMVGRGINGVIRNMQIIK